MQWPRVRFSVRWTMVLIAAISVYFALLRSPIGPLIVLLTGPMIGTAIQRSAGGRGILGGVIGGIAEVAALIVVAIIQAMLFTVPNQLSPDLDLLMWIFALGGIGVGVEAVIGLITGLVIWGLMELKSLGATGSSANP
jgi:hypothetical protein